jgi:ribosome-associated protein
LSAPKIGRPSSLSGSGGRRAGLPDRETVPGADLVAHDAAGALELGRRVVELAADKKAADIVLIGIAELTTVADYLVICSGSSERQLGAIADGIVAGLREVGVRPIGREGGPGAHWVLLDLGAVVVHVFAPPERDYYQLERLWADAPTVLRVQ